MNWWIVPGIAVVAFGIALMLLNVVFSLFGKRPNSVGMRALFLQRVGIGLLFVGLGISMFLPALERGPDLGGLILGALIAGFGGLYFISVTDPVFRRGTSLMDLQTTTPAPKREAPKQQDETLEAKAKRLHELVHPEEASNSSTDRRSKSDLDRS
ncbi:MAG: hypothetical protein WEE67_01265 [Chloroflexota bacterium]